MSKRQRGQRARSRRAKLIAMRAELALVMENRLEPRFLQYNTLQTQRLLEHFTRYGELPLWAVGYVKQSSWMNTPAKDWIYDDQLDAHARAFDAAILTGTGVVRLTTDQ